MNKVVVSLKLTRRKFVMNNFRRRRRQSLKSQRRVFAKIPNDLKLKILSCLPPKSLFKLRCVSKEFCCLIDDPLFALEHARRLAANSIRFTGFFIKDRDHLLSEGEYQQLSFISTNNIDGGGLPDSSLSFLKEDQLKDDVKLMDSCNGLLLCKIITKTSKYSSINEEKLFVCNPLTMQKVFVPHPRTRGYPRPYNKYFALICKSTSMGYLRYKVVYIYDIPTKPRVKKYSKLWIFSSEIGEWEEFHYRLPALCFGSLMAKRTRMFVKGTTLIWDCFASGKFILVCYFDKEVSSSLSSSRCFELIESPCQYQFVRCLWDYHGKLLFYFNELSIDSHHHQEKGKLSAWSLCFGDNDKIEWKNENSLHFKTLAEDFWKHWNHQEYPGRELIDEITIVGYKPSLKTMYVLMGSVLLSYELDERRFELVWECYRDRNESSVAFKYIHSMEPIEIGRTKTDISTTVDDETEYDDDDDDDDVDDVDDDDDDPILRDDDVVLDVFI